MVQGGAMGWRRGSVTCCLRQAGGSQGWLDTGNEGEDRIEDHVGHRASHRIKRQVGNAGRGVRCGWWKRDRDND